MSPARLTSGTFSAVSASEIGRWRTRDKAGCGNADAVEQNSFCSPGLRSACRQCSPNQLAAATRIFRAYSQQRPDSADGGYDVQHSTYLYLVGPDGRFRRQISSDATAGELAA